MPTDAPPMGLDSPTVLVVLDDFASVLAEGILDVPGEHAVRRAGNVEELLDLLGSGGEEVVGVIALAEPDRRVRAVERVRMEHPATGMVVVAQQATVEEVEDLHRFGVHSVVVEQEATRRIVHVAMEARLHARQWARALESASRSAALLEHTLVGVLLTDPEGPVLSANPAACRILGYTEEEICALGREGLMDTSDPALANALAHRAEHGWVHAQLTMIRADGDRFPADVTSVRFTDLRGRPRTTTLFQDIADRVQAEQELRASEHRFAVLLDSIPDPTFMKDVQGRYVYANRSWERISGVRSEQFLGRTDFELWPELAPHCVADDRVALETGEVVITEDEAILPDGRRTVTETVKAPVRNGGDEWEGVICVARDVTDRKAAMDALRDSEARYRLLFEAMAEGVVYQAPDGQIFDANLAASRILGWPREVMLGRTSEDPVWDTVYPDESPYPAQDLPPMVALRTGESQGPIKMGIRNGVDGGRHWLRVTSNPILDPDTRKVQGVCTTFVDITELHNSIEERTASEARFAALVENGPDIVVRLDRDGRILFVSRGVARLGHSQSALVGRFFPDVTADPEHADRIAREVEEVFRTGEPTQFELANTEGVVVEFRVVPERANGDESAETVLVVIRDVTEYRRLETHLRHTQRMEAVGRLAGGVAHDFNNLLTAIRGHADFAMEAFSENDPARADMESIQQTVDRAVALSRQLLAFSRKQQLEPRIVDPAQVLDNLGRMLTRIIGEDVELGIECATDRVIRVDPTQFEQVIVNLVVNARDAQPEGGRIDLVLTERDLDVRRARAMDGSPEAGPYVVLSVSDRGTGIDPDTLEHMFEPFYTTKPEGRGTGLGLSTVYGIVRQSGGWIDVKTRAGVGTAFMIGLPALDRISQEETPEPAVRAPASDLCATILVVEDEGPVLEVCRRTLTAVGHRVLTAQSGEEAVVILQESREPVDLIITDAVLPGMRGYELFRAFRGAAPDTCVMFMSGHAVETLEEAGVPVGEVAFLPKPFDTATLREKVAQTLQRAAGRRARDQ